MALGAILPAASVVVKENIAMRKASREKPSEAPSKSAHAPGPRGWPVVGVLPRLARDPLGFLEQVRARYGDVASFAIPGSRSLRILVSDPALAGQVLLDADGLYTKASRELRPVFGNGLLTSEGDAWRRQRRVTQASFGPSALERYAVVVRREAEAVVDELERLHLQGVHEAVVDVLPVMMELTLRIVMRTLLGTALQADAAASARIGQAVATALAHTQRRMFARTPLARWRLARQEPAFRAAMAELHAVADRAVAAAEDPGLLWQLRAAGEHGDELRDQVVTMLLAGHETTALALTWTWYLAAEHLDVDTRLADAAAPDHARYVRAVIEEAMRLYPPAWILVRKAVAAHALGGYAVPEGSDVIVSPYVLHRHPDLWEAPSAFRPDRFLEPRRGRIVPYAYLPFGGGPRRCIGSQLALLEADAVVAAVARRLRFMPALPGSAAVATPQLTLRPRGGMRLRMGRRGEV
jgi:cytochrome P450